MLILILELLSLFYFITDSTPFFNDIDLQVKLDPSSRTLSHFLGVS